MAKRKRTKGQTTIRSIKLTHKTKDRIIRLLVGDVLSFYVLMLVMFNIYYMQFSDKPKDCNKLRVITKLPNSEQSYKGKIKTHKYINRQNQSTTGKL